MCVRNADDHCVLQFTLIHAAGCVLHRRTSRVIHRQELSTRFSVSSRGSGRAPHLSFVRSQLTGLPAPRGLGRGDLGQRGFAGRAIKSVRPAHGGSRVPRGSRWPLVGGRRVAPPLQIDSASPRVTFKAEPRRPGAPDRKPPNCSRRVLDTPDPAADRAGRSSTAVQQLVATPGVGPLPRTHPETSLVGAPAGPPFPPGLSTGADMYISGGLGKAGSPGCQTSRVSLSLVFR